MPSDHDALIATYLSKVDDYRSFALRIRELIEHLLGPHRKAIHSITCRHKDVVSLRGKLQRASDAGRPYTHLRDVTDLAGVRLVCYFADDVDRLGDLLIPHFAVDQAHSTDRRAALEPDRFGYLSLHYVIGLDPTRAALAEYAPYRELKLELQIRSILQHAWAEIEHDLGYKGTLEVPRFLRRRISRLAGLLEIADQEFWSVRDEITHYEHNLGELIAQTPHLVDLNKPALQAFAASNKTVHAIDKAIARAAKTKLSSEARVDHAVKRLAWLGFTTLAGVENALTEHQNRIIGFARHFLTPGGRVGRGISLFYLAYVLAARAGPRPKVQSFVRHAMGETDSADANYLTEKLIETARTVTKEQVPARPTAKRTITRRRPRT